MGKTPGRVLPYQEVGGGLGPGIEFRGKIWGKVQSSSPNKRKNLGSSVTTRRKNWERITILGAFGVISEIQRAKFGVSVTYIFGSKIWGSDMNFRGKIWGQAPPQPSYMEVPPLGVKLKVKSIPYLKSGYMTGIIKINKKKRKLHKQRVGLEIAN